MIEEGWEVQTADGRSQRDSKPEGGAVRVVELKSKARMEEASESPDPGWKRASESPDPGWKKASESPDPGWKRPSESPNPGWKRASESRDPGRKRDGGV